MSSGEGTLGVCDACRGYITEEKDGRPYIIASISSKGYEHSLCSHCANNIFYENGTPTKIINFIVSMYNRSARSAQKEK
jgi:hypothetical protein